MLRAMKEAGYDVMAQVPMFQSKLDQVPPVPASYYL